MQWLCCGWRATMDAWSEVRWDPGNPWLATAPADLGVLGGSATADGNAILSGEAGFCSSLTPSGRASIVRLHDGGGCSLVEKGTEADSVLVLCRCQQRELSSTCE
jgi:hypothetical protein